MNYTKKSTQLLYTPGDRLKHERVIFHVDMNAFFASVEQVLNPELRGKPIAVVPSLKYKKAAIVTCSYEAKAKGVKAFMRLDEARALCPDIIPVTSRHGEYYRIHGVLWEIMQQFTEVVEPYSIDEFFLDVTDYFKFRPWLTYKDLGFEIKAEIARKVHPVLRCSIGVGPNKLLAKVGSDYQKPDGFTVIPWEERLHYLDSLALGDIWGIGYNSAPKLQEAGIHSTSDLRNTSDLDLRALVGGYYTRLKLIANGESYDRVSGVRHMKPRKSMQHAHTLSKATNDDNKLLDLAYQLTEKIARRLRKHQQKARVVALYIRLNGQRSYGWGSKDSFPGAVYPKQRAYAYVKLEEGTSIGAELFVHIRKLYFEIKPIWRGYLVRLMAVSVAELVSDVQIGLFAHAHKTRWLEVLKSVDRINEKFGQFTMRPAALTNSSAKISKPKLSLYPLSFHTD